MSLSIHKNAPFHNREISWLSFNERVLQEADDPSVPLIERLRFLGIYSNNRDEFFRVRVAILQRMAELNKKEQKLLLENPSKVLVEIQKAVLKQEKLFQGTYARLMKLLEHHDIFLIDQSALDDVQKEFLKQYFKEQVRQNLVPIMLDTQRPFPFLHDRTIYLAIKLSKSVSKKEVRYALIEIPTQVLGRFVVLPSRSKKEYIILLDDIVRFGLKEVFQIFDYDKIEAYSIKVTRDAELDMEEDISMSLVDKLSKSVKDRDSGEPVRFIYDQNIPKDLLQYILKHAQIKKSCNIISSGRYHNFRDFLSFPALGHQELTYEPIQPIAQPYLKGIKSYLQTILKKDILLYYPYHTFNHVIDILREAAIDPQVESIKINLYRLAKNSKVINTLINAAHNGKQVTVVVELQARFDEEANINWAEKLQEEGVKVVFGMQGLKVHAKLILIGRKNKSKTQYIAHIGSGNFNESTAKIYTDISLFTAHEGITQEVEKIFDFFDNPFRVKRYQTLIVSPFTTRRKFLQFIEDEMQAAQEGLKAGIELKLNNLVDPEMIQKLYEASQAGVHIRLIIRGICSLVPGVKGYSENIQVISIVDRFLEHARIAIFHHRGNPTYYISSADWMGRNLDRRIEVSTPILDKGIQKIIRHVMDLQWADNVKARVIGKTLENKYIRDLKKPTRSQLEVHNYFLNNAEKKIK